MYSRLTIDTAVGAGPGPTSANSRYRRTPSPAGPKLPARRVRSVSNASSTSSLSIVSPLSSSTNDSTTSLLIPNTADEAGHTRSRSVSPAMDETIRLGPDYVLAMHDYSPTNGHATCLSFRAGQVIHVLNRDSSGWWDGELDDRRGWFPSNYVSSEIINLRDEEPLATRFTPGHHHSDSSASATSWVSSTGSSSPRRTHSRSVSTSTTGSANGDNESYCPPLMVPLLHGLTLLQNAVRANRIQHFQPSTACIISCVRSTLTATETLNRDSPILQIHPKLADERRRILTVLASLVAQAKKASDPAMPQHKQGEETAAMVRMAGQVFAHLRRFLSVAAECGVELPDEPDPDTARSTMLSDTESERDTPMNTGRTPTQNRALSMQQGNGATSMPLVRRRSQTEMRGRMLSPTSHAHGSLSANPILNGRMRQEQQESISRRTPVRGHRYNDSASSISSLSSLSSQDSAASTPPAPFPNGPSSAVQVLDALRYTHDQYLSTIAAFIGHAHSHSRTSHASSTGQLYDLVREIVELVCKLLTIVEAVLQHPDVPGHRIGSLKGAKEGLFNVTSSLAESVRLLTMSLPSSLSEEDEKKALLQSATSALKAGSDCVGAVRSCLTRSLGDRPFIVNLPNSTDLTQPFAPNTLTGPSLVKLVQEPGDAAPSRIDASYQLAGMDDEDITIQAVTPTDAHRRDQHPHDDHPLPQLPLQRQASSSTSSLSETSSISRVSIQSRHPSVETAATSIAEQLKPPPKGLTPLKLNNSQVSVEPDLPSPTSFVRSDDGTTWEGSIREHPAALRPGLEQIHSTYGHGQHDGLPPLPHDELPGLVHDPTAWMLSHDYSIEDVAYNNEGHLVGATMGALVEKMTPHDSLVDPAFSAVFFLTFRLFSAPLELVDAVIARYNLTPPQGITREDEQLWQQQKGIPVRLRVSNFIKTWLDTYWRSGVDDAALNALTAFTREGLALLFPGPAQRILDLLNMRRQSSDAMTSPRGDRSRDPGMLINPPSLSVFSPSAQDIPRPTMTKTLLNMLRKRDFANITITDFDALELARQLTIMECDLYCAIQPNEILESGSTAGGGAPPVNVRAVSSLSTVITGWVAESILDELDLKKRTLLVKFFVKLSDRCVVLQNYSTSRSILAALDSSTIARLRQTWAGLPQKYKAQMETLRKLADHSRNYHEYRSRLRNTSPPAVPFLGLYLTDVTFCREGNPSHRPSPRNPAKKLINFNKYHKLARIVQDMQRFQVQYNLKAIPEVQEYLNVAFERARHHGDLQDLYRRSLLVEPKQPADSVPANDVRQLFGWATRAASAS